MVPAITIFFLHWVRDEYRSYYDPGREAVGKKSQQTPQQGAELAQNCDYLQAVFGCVCKKYFLKEEFVKLFTNRGALAKNILALFRFSQFSVPSVTTGTQTTTGMFYPQGYLSKKQSTQG